VPPFATAPLDINVETLPPAYLGHSCRGVAKALIALNPAKDEYETTTAYKERTDALASKPLVGSTAITDYVAFLQTWVPITSKYDADSGTLTIDGYALPSMTMVKSRAATSIVVDMNIVSKSTYSASNAYGKQVEVTKTNIRGCALAFPEFGYGYRLQNYHASVQMTAEEARAVKGNIGALFVGKLTEPYWAEYSNYAKPTIDSPTEAYWSGDALVMKNIQVWLFDKVTGRIYQKTPL
jgi:hypothetical protein